MICAQSVFRAFKALERWGDRATGYAGPYFVGLAVILIGTGTFAFRELYDIYLGSLLTTTFYPVEVTALNYPFKIITFPICVLLIVNMFGHYYLACTTPPGYAGDGPLHTRSPSNSWQWASPSKPHTKREVVTLNITQATESKCKRCGVMRPEVCLFECVHTAYHD